MKGVCQNHDYIIKRLSEATELFLGFPQAEAWGFGTKTALRADKSFSLDAFVVLVDGGEDAEFFLEVFAESFRASKSGLIGYFRDIELAFAE